MKGNPERGGGGVTMESQGRMQEFWKEGAHFVLKIQNIWIKRTQFSLRVTFLVIKR